MNNAFIVIWDAVKYPVTIVKDRYAGVNSGGVWLAFPCFPEGIPEEVFGEDFENCEFWESNKEPVGKGRWPNDALDDLEYLMKELKKKI